MRGCCSSEEAACIAGPGINPSITLLHGQKTVLQLAANIQKVLIRGISVKPAASIPKSMKVGYWSHKRTRAEYLPQDAAVLRPLLRHPVLL